ncbi:MAG TPA: lipoprotein [Ramlibacter sp.]|nr:lipoprotein [Ramlibacter sp.]
MFGVIQILVSAAPRRLALAACAVALLGACGQKGPLFLPQGEAAGGRATLPGTLTPSTAVSNPVGPASAPPPTGTAAPVRQ